MRSGEGESSGSTGKPVRGIDNQLERTRLVFHTMQISDYRSVEKVFRNLRPKLTLSEDAQVFDLKINVLILRLFMSTTMKASVHLGPNYNQNLKGYRNTNFEDLKTLFDITQRSILHHADEILNVSAIEWTFSRQTRSTLLHDQVIKWTKAKVHVYTDSVLCLGKMQELSGANKKWTDQHREFQRCNDYRELIGIDGEPIEFEWNIFPGLTRHRSKKILQDQKTDTEHLEGRLNAKSMFSDIDWTKYGNSEICISNSEQVKNYAKRFRVGAGHSSVHEKKNGTERTPTNLKEKMELHR